MRRPLQAIQLHQMVGPRQSMNTLYLEKEFGHSARFFIIDIMIAIMPIATIAIPTTDRITLNQTMRPPL
ncbi:hypothetical protein AYJ56_18815 [Brucella anthropi]|nr:hypothetical protein AYJ56_18815 [Brucella anthropi]